MMPNPIPDGVKVLSVSELTRRVKAVVEGKYDNLPEQAFYMVGGIEDVEKKAREMEQ